VVRELERYDCNVDIHDPWVNEEEAELEFGTSLVNEIRQGYYDAIIVAVAHDQFKAIGSGGVRAFGKQGALVYDLKYIFPKDESDLRL
jgi:UDP-N-acetyl-D-galactosamine dehydrogenase